MRIPQRNNLVPTNKNTSDITTIQTVQPPRLGFWNSLNSALNTIITKQICHCILGKIYTKEFYKTFNQIFYKVFIVFVLISLAGNLFLNPTLLIFLFHVKQTWKTHLRLTISLWGAIFLWFERILVLIYMLLQLRGITPAPNPSYFISYLFGTPLIYFNYPPFFSQAIPETLR